MPKRFFPFTLSRDDSAAAVRAMRPGRHLAFTTGGTTPIDQQLADWFNANNAVMAYVLSLTNSTLPALSPPPSWYNSFVNQFSDAKTHAMEWQNSVTPGLVAIPTGIINYALIWSLNNNTISQAISVLDTDPTNQQAQQAVLKGLQNLLSGLSSQLSAATSFQSTIDTFSSQLTTDAKNMQQAIQQAQQTEGYDAQQVQQLQNDINSLNDEISTWQTVVTAAAIAAGVAFFVGAVIAIFTFGAGLAFGIIGAAAGITLVIVGEEKIKALSAQVAQDQSSMSSLNQQIAALKLLESNMNTLISLSSSASQQIQLLIQAWQVLEQEITQVITDLNNAQGDLSNVNISQLQADMSQANVDWQALQSFCTVLAGINYNQAAPATVTLPTTQQTSLAA